MSASTRRIDYKTAMRAMVDSRRQASSDVKSGGKPGTVNHQKGAGIAHPQNKLTPGEAGTGSRSGAKGGPSEHPQNLIGASATGSGTDAASAGSKGGPSPNAQGLQPPTEGSKAEEAGESVQFEAQERAGGAEHGNIDNTVAGPTATGRPGQRIPYGGTGEQGRGGKGGGEHAGHPQNNISTSGAGEGGDGKGGAGGGGRGREGHPQNKVLPVVKGKRATGGATAKKTASAALGRFLAGK